MPTVVGIRLRFSKTLWFDPKGLMPAEGDRVVVETERGTELGTVVQPPHEVTDDQLPAPLKSVVRVVNDEDRALIEELEAKEREAMPVFRDLVAEYKLDMKPIDVEYLFGGDKVIFYFSAEERVDFRELVKELASKFQARIDMRQVGVRDEARMVGGLGHCGQMLCCVRFGGEFQPVSIRMAKEQDLPLNPLKISGLCGRLMCCLRYEFDAYKDFKSRAPKRGAIIDTPVGPAKVSEMNTPRETVTMRFEDGNRVTVPLGSMSCGKGSGCPCHVGQQALEEAGNAAALALSAETDAPVVLAEPKLRSEKPAEPRRGDRKPDERKQDERKTENGATRDGGRRRRRRGGKPADETQPESGTKAEAPKPEPRQSAPRRAPKEQQAAEPSSESGGGAAPSGRRRRRRRKPGGGDKPDAPK